MIYRLENDEELTETKLWKFINQHETEKLNKYEKLKKLYENKPEIFDLKEKAQWKPDNRLAVGFAKYITDTFNGFFCGVPIKISANDDKVKDFLTMHTAYVDFDDMISDLARYCDMYGIGYTMNYVDEEGLVNSIALSPMESFMIVDDSVLARKLYFVRTYKDKHNIMHGSISDAEIVRYFEINPDLVFLPEYEKPHGFDGVPATEWKENTSCMGLYEGQTSLIDNYNKTLSEQANDIDYFADAYMKILGAKLEQEDLETLRDNRIINFDGNNDGNLIVEFMAKPDGNATQEAHLNRLENLIFKMSMVADISDDDFGANSGIALKYKLQAMSNLATIKARKFSSALNSYFKLVFSNPVTPVNEDDWLQLSYRFTQNYPLDLLDEAQTAGALSGIVSKETQLNTLSIVDDVAEEMKKIEQEYDPLNTIEYNLERSTDE